MTSTSAWSLEAIDACELLERVAGEAGAVIYVDPPYPSVKPLYGSEPDWTRLRAALAAQRGAVAVSGYGDEWDALGWRRVERRTTTQIGASVDHRVEVLWANYDATATQGALMFTEGPNGTSGDSGVV